MGKTTAPTGEARRSAGEIWGTTGFIALFAVGLSAWAIWGAADIRPLLVVLAVAAALVSLLVHRVMSTDVIRLTGTHVETVSLFGSRRLALTDIAGARSGQVIQLLDETGRIRMALPEYGARSPEILRWVQGLKNIGWQEAIEVLDTLEADPRLGFNTADRQANLRRMQRVARVLTLISVGVIFWSLFPVPYDVVLIVAAVLPVLALTLVILRPWIFTIGGTDTTGIYPDLSALFWSSACVFGLRTMFDVHTTPWYPPLVAAVVIAGLLLAFVWRMDRRARSPISMVMLGATLVAIAWGGLSIFNARYDTSPQVVTPVEVSGTWGGKRPSVRVRLPETYGGGEQSFNTPWWLAASARNDVPICLVVSDGLFGWSHRFLTSCDLTD